MAIDKANRPKARVPRGFADRTPVEIRRVAEMMEKIRGVYERWGFEPVETPLIEYADALGKFLPDQDRPNEGVFAFQDDDEQWLSLRYDLTAPLARMVAENYERIPKPYKSYRAGWVFRNEKPGPGRFRQFMQFDADIVGAASPLADAEICMMAADTMEALKFRRGDYLLKVSSRKILDGMLAAIGVNDQETKLRVLRSVDKYDRIDHTGVLELLTCGRKDDSGDFTVGASLTLADAEKIISTLGLSSDLYFADSDYLPDADTTITFGTLTNSQRIAILRDADFNHPQYVEGVTELEDIIRITDLAENVSLGGQMVRIEPSVVRGLEYYTGAVFEAELTLPIADDEGRPQKFGAVGGGGRYDGLVGRFRGEDVPATGFSIGVSRLAAALAARDQASAQQGPVIVTVMDRDAIPAYQAMTAKLRAALNPPDARKVVPVEMYIGDAGMKAQLKYADRRNAPCVIIQGSNERTAGKVQIKDLAAGKAASGVIGDRRDWIAARPAQVEVDADIEAIAVAVRAILGC